MDVKELNKSQLILLALLISFVTSIATGISTVTLMQQAPPSVTTPINKIVMETVQKISPSSVATDALTPDQEQLLQNLKVIKPLTVSLYLKGATEADDKLLGTGLFLGDNKVVIASAIDAPQTGQTYIVKSVLGEQQISKLTPEKDFTVVELTPVAPVTPDASTPAGGTTPTSPVTPPAGTTAQ